MLYSRLEAMQILNAKDTPLKDSSASRKFATKQEMNKHSFLFLVINIAKLFLSRYALKPENGDIAL